MASITKELVIAALLDNYRALSCRTYIARLGHACTKRDLVFRVSSELDLNANDVEGVLLEMIDDNVLRQISVEGGLPGDRWLIVGLEQVNQPTLEDE